MPIPAGKSSIVWVDGVVLYRDDIVQLARLSSGDRADGLSAVSVRYKNQSTTIENADLDEVDLESVARINIAHQKAVIDTEEGRVRVGVPHGYPDIKTVGDFFDRLERIKQPSRLHYLFTKPNPYRVKLINLTRSQVRARRPDLKAQVAFWTTVAAGAAAVVGAAAGVAALLK